MTTERIRVDAKKLTDFSTKALQRLGVPEEDAQITARILVATDLRGVDSHGVTHLNPFYDQTNTIGNYQLKPEAKDFQPDSSDGNYGR